MGDSHQKHHQHSHAPANFIAEVERVCDSRGLRLTATRHRVLEMIASSDKPVKAYDLLDSLKHEKEGAAPPTIYRALDFLLEHGFIHKLESINAYTSCHHPSEAHSVPFLICNRCHKATELCDQSVSQSLLEHARNLGFVTSAQTLEVHGVCRYCVDTKVDQKA